MSGWAERQADDQRERAEEAIENRELVMRYEEALGKILVLATKCRTSSESVANVGLDYIIKACEDAGFRITS